jgi:deoxyribodipyrimidine photo-lyase
MNILVWLQRDLRLSDHAALIEALADADKVVLAYIHDPSHQIGEANSVWLAHSLLDLQTSIQAKGGELAMCEGAFGERFEQLLKAFSIDRVYYHFGIGAFFDRQQQQALDICKHYKVALKPYHQAWCPAEQIVTQKGDYYSVFTPFYKKLSGLLNQVAYPLEAPKDLTKAAQKQAWSLPQSLQALIDKPWARKLMSNWQAGEHQAWSSFEHFVEQDLNAYPQQRDFPAESGTSKLSIALHFGEVSSRELLHRMQSLKTDPNLSLYAIDAFIRQLAWREFAHYLLAINPELETRPYQSKFENLSWQDEPHLIQGWQSGQTGIPIIDAGMRELWHTGWMHNRVRMLVASWLTKNANQHWLHCQNWFADTLFDADPDNNTMGWQWVAGCGVDAAPYYRLFNPVLQSEKFDPEAVYIKRWLPELQALPVSVCHAPWRFPIELAEHGLVLEQHYPAPKLDLDASRQDHLARVGYLKQIPKSYT